MYFALCQRSNIKPSLLWDPYLEGRTACCPCMGEQANNSALEKLALNFTEICIGVLQDWSEHVSEKSPWKC